LKFDGGAVRKKLKKMAKKITKRLMGDTDVAKIARRYLVMNSFDGSLAILGVVVGTYMAEGASHPHIIISSGLGASVAMGISGFMGAYLIERSERIRDNNNGEESNDDVHGESMSLALVAGLSPFLVTLIAVIPFFLSLKHIINIEAAFVSSIVIIMVELFTLGVFLGKIARKNMIFHGLIALFVGGVTFLIVSILPF